MLPLPCVSFFSACRSSCRNSWRSAHNCCRSVSVCADPARQLLPVLLELLEILLQLSVVARGHVGFDVLQIGLELLPDLLLLAIVVLQGLAILGEVAGILLNLLIRGARRSRRRRTGGLSRRRRCSAAGLLAGLLRAALAIQVFAQLPLVVPQFVAVGRQLLPVGLRLRTILMELLPVLFELLEVLLQLSRCRPRPGRL